MLQYEPISLEKAPEFNRLYSLCSEKSSDSAFLNMWAWQDTYHYEWAFDGDLCWVRHNYGDGYIYNAPIGNWDNQDWAKLIAEKLPPKAEMDRIPAVLALKLHLACGSKIKIKEQPDHWEYVYEVQQLIDLAGSKYHTKRQLANHFVKFYDYRFEDITPKIIPKILKFQTKWMKEQGAKKDEYIKQENIAVRRILNQWDELPRNLVGGALFVNDEIVAYTTGEITDSQEIMIHFEKADIELKGAYQAINRIFLEHHSSYKFVNREQDLGIPGLRRAKQEYCPCIFVKKYYIHKVD